MKKISSTVFPIGGCLALMLFSAMAVSCEDKIENVAREDLIKVYTSLPASDNISTLYVAAVGGTVNLYLDTDIEYDITWQDGQTSPWISVTDDGGTDPSTGCRILSLDVGKLSTSHNYTVRTGSLILSAKNTSLVYRKVISIRQGLESRFSNTFSDWTYGTTDPADETGETLFDDWSTAQTNVGFDSTPFEGGEIAYCYGKNGYLKLGDSAGHGADLITPFNSDFGDDEELVVSFRAVAYVDPTTGEQDANRLTVTVLNGGVIEDFGDSRTTSIEFEAPYYDVSSSNYASNMWNGTDFLVFIKSTSQVPLSTSTRIQFTAGSLTQLSVRNNRIFIDNIRIYCRNSEGEENLFSKNGGSGLDTVL